jgi:hypothetical protein
VFSLPAKPVLVSEGQQGGMEKKMRNYKLLQYNLLIVIFFSINSVWAGFESYLTRPNILEIDSSEKPHSDLYFERGVISSIETIAEVLELYPNHEIYFMGRDAEFLYDAAIKATQGTSDELRIHLILSLSFLASTGPFVNLMFKSSVSIQNKIACI